jgi:hypothetical protein
MARRSNNLDIETGDEKDNNKRHTQYRLKEQDKFISRSYWMCTTLFFITGIAMTVTLLQGAYEEVVLAENIMISVFGTVYMILFIVMCFCHKNESLRVAILLFITGFISLVAGFMIGVNLKTVVDHLKDGDQ